MVEGRHTWIRPAGLLAVGVSLSVFQPLVLVAIPFAFLALGAPARTMATIVAGVVALVLVLGGVPQDGLWLVERGWSVLIGGWFLALTLLRPEMRLTDRALGAVGGAILGAAAFLLAQPESWGVLDWMVKSRILEGASLALGTMTELRGDAGLPKGLTQTLLRTADFQGTAFPAIVALASLASLGVAWWLFVRLARGRGHGLDPLKGFRFNNDLVWLLIGGVLLMALGLGDPWTRAGVNALVFMGGLYILRGGAVVLALTGGISVSGIVLFVLGLAVAAPLIMIGALIIGLGDTWVDIRARGSADSG